MVGLRTVAKQRQTGRAPGANTAANLDISLCFGDVVCVTICSILLCTLGAFIPLDCLHVAPRRYQENVFSGTGIFQIISGLCYDTREFVTFYTILPYRPQCSVTVGLSEPHPARSATQPDAAHNRLSGIDHTTGILVSTRS